MARTGWTRRGVATLTVGALVALAGACSSSEDSASTTESDSSGASWDCGADCDWGSGGAAGERTTGAVAIDAEAAPSTEEPGVAIGPEVVDTRVTAGSVDDNEAWEDYLLYRQSFDLASLRGSVRDVPVEGRQVIAVVDPEGRPVLGARVAVEDSGGEVVANLTTYADGRTLFHAPLGDVDPNTQRRASYTLAVTPPGGGDVVRHRLDPDQRTHTVELGSGSVEGVRLDVALLLDATGSMGDEIDRLKANMVSVAEQIAAHPSNPDVRFGLTVYRDEGDAFVTRSFAFTGDVAEFTAALRDVQADGGGDEPEALEEGLAEVVTGQEWRDDAVQLVMLVADAPPHLRSPGYDETLRAAAARGIKVFPIAASGAASDPATEYVFRQIAQFTMARFVFLTYGADGGPTGEHTDHSVEPGSYDVLALDELVVKLVDDELTDLG